MHRIIVAVGVAFDLLIVLLLIVVFGWTLDSWHDRDPWAGPVVTTLWTLSLLLAAGAPVVAYRFSRRTATPARIAMVVWAPVLVLVGLTLIGFVVFTPNE
jgi:hypothetical protein